MPITAGALAQKISELQSRVTVQEKLREILKQNYMPSDSGPGELAMIRSDGFPIVRAHFELSIADIDERIDMLNAELEEWTSLIFDDSKPKVALVAPPEATPIKEKSRAPRRVSSPQPPAK